MPAARTPSSTAVAASAAARFHISAMSDTASSDVYSPLASFFMLVRYPAVHSATHFRALAAASPKTSPDPPAEPDPDDGAAGGWGNRFAFLGFFLSGCRRAHS